MQFFESFSSKHLEVTRKVYTFASALQNKPPGKLLKAVKKEFFERIYINREVVQEARHVAICVLGRINEPINSSKEVMGNGTVSDCFLSPLLSCFQFVFLLLNQGDSF